MPMSGTKYCGRMGELREEVTLYIKVSGTPHVNIFEIG